MHSYAHCSIIYNSQDMDEMVGWHHWLSAHEFEQALGDGEGQGSLECYSPWGRKESDTTERLNNNNSNIWKQPQRLSIDDRIKRIWHIYIHIKEY